MPFDDPVEKGGVEEGECVSLPRSEHKGSKSREFQRAAVAPVDTRFKPNSKANMKPLKNDEPASVVDRTSGVVKRASETVSPDFPISS